MSLIDILFRVDEICKKYDKYDPDTQRQLNANVDDAFARLYSILDSEIQNTLRKAEMASMETDRAKKVAMRAEVRRTKARLAEEAAKLHKLATKKVKGLSKDDMIARNDMVIMLPDRIMEIPDGDTSNASKSSGFGASGSRNNIKMDSSDGGFNTGFYEETGESSQFRREYEMRKIKQDQGLDFISDGLDALKNLAIDMNEELDRQVPLMDDIEERVDKASSELKKNNVRIKENLYRVKTEYLQCDNLTDRLRSSRNFCADIILLCIILGIAAYLYNMLQ